MKIEWKRARQIFGFPNPPSKVTESQFDYCDDELQKLGTTPYEDIDFGDLWYYHHDLAYVDLQPDLFAYLFPVCLMDWHTTFVANESCSHGDSEFHYGLRHGNVLEKMVTQQQRDEIGKFFHDSLMERIDLERGSSFAGKAVTVPHGWISRFNSLGLILPIIPDVWNTWWSLESVGRAVAALQYLSGFMYFEGENPIFDMWTPEEGGGGPYLWENDAMIYDAGWLPENVEFLAGTLTTDFVEESLRRVLPRLEGQPEQAKAQQLVDDFTERVEIVELRTAELPQLLVSKSSMGWTV